MEVYDSEQQTVEALKKWWKENGTTVVIGVVLGLGAIFGWTGWNEYKVARSNGASGLYAAQANALDARQYEESDKHGLEILAEFDDTGYVTLATFLLARSAYEQGRSADARRHLQSVLDGGAAGEYEALARIRLARIALDDGEPDAALALLDFTDAGTFLGLATELKGDALLSQDDNDGARAAYEQALTLFADLPASQRRVEAKLDDLGHVNYATN